MSERAIGIDLGTTHTAIARAESVDGSSPKTSLVPVVQLTRANEVGARPLLPSFLYFAHESESACSLPWDAARSFAIGEFARSRGVEAPKRIISSAKSWLCHSGVDRRKCILPDGAPDDIERISPVEASYRYLEHLVESYAHSESGKALSDEEIVLTVPASFDAAARDLTVEAALAAGLENLTLLEEPQAALYAWIESHSDSFRKELKVGDLILVVDVGGGTTDFSAIEVRESEGSIELARVAVGDHILLGGDNMDLALAYVAKQKLEQSGKTLERSDIAALTFAARETKERLLSDGAIEMSPIAIAKKGSQLLGSTLRAEISQAEVQKTILEGFFPLVPRAARPLVRARTGLREIGLPYAAEPAITKHLAAFLAKHSGASKKSKEDFLCPSLILFNGGVMKSSRIQSRLVDALSSWMTELGAPSPRVLDGADLDHAVARGAAYYALARKGRGLRIRGGTSRAYYIGIETSTLAVPGVEPPLHLLCVASMGMEEGTASKLEPRELGVVVGEAVRFRFFGSTVRRNDVPGLELESWNDREIEELPPIEIALPSEGRAEGDLVPVILAAQVTDVGTLLIEAVALEPRKKDERWKLELSVRSEG